MGAVLGLQVLLGVPVAVEEDDGVGGGEVDALAAGAGAEEEEALVRLRVEGGDLLAPLVLLDGAVDAAHGPAVLQRGPVFEDVELRFELREDEDFVGFAEEVGDEAVEEEHFARVRDQRGVWGLVVFPGPVEVVGRVAGEAELHDGVLEFFVTNFSFCACVSFRSGDSTCYTYWLVRWSSHGQALLVLRFQALPSRRYFPQVP